MRGSNCLHETTLRVHQTIYVWNPPPIMSDIFRKEKPFTRLTGFLSANICMPFQAHIRPQDIANVQLISEETKIWWKNDDKLWFDTVKHTLSSSMIYWQNRTMYTMEGRRRIRRKVHDVHYNKSTVCSLSQPRFSDFVCLSLRLWLSFLYKTKHWLSEQIINVFYCDRLS